MMKLKKIFSVFTALLTAVVFPLSAMAESEEINPELSGYVTLMVDGGFIMNDANFGQVLCNTDETTILEGYITEDGVSEGDYVIVQYDGRMTRSIPPQVHADRICAYRLDGTVLEIMDENVLAIDVPEQGEVWVYVENISSNVIPGMNVTVFYDGIMALSYPARVSARELVLPEVTGTVGEISQTESGTGFLLTTEEGQVEIVVTAQTQFSQLKNVESAEVSEETVTEEILLSGSADAEAAEEPAGDDVSDVTEAVGPTAEETPAEELPAEDSPVEETAGEESAEELIGEEEVLPAETADEQPAEEPASEADAAPAVSVSDFLKEGDRVTVYYGGTAGGEGPLHALKIVILP